VADRKITDLTALTTPASADVLPIVDVSEAAAADKNKKITVGELFKGVPDGTAAAPAIAFESDDGNGIFLSTTDTVGIATNGSSRMTVSTTAVTSTLPVIVPDGTAAAPSVAFTGSGTDTGFYSAAANTLAASTGGTNALYIDSSQRVGIGATSLGTVFEKLYVAGRGRFQESPSSGAIAIIGADATAAYFDTGTYGGVQPIAFRLNGTEKARIDSSGRLGLGTSSPSNTLHVVDSSSQYQGTVRLGGGSGSSGYYATIEQDALASGKLSINSVAASGSAHGIQLQVDGTSALAINSSGNVGIGKTSLNSTFEIYHDTVPYIFLQNSTSGTSASDGFSILLSGSDAYINNRENGAMLFYNNGSERFRCDSSGRLLVGTSSSSATATAIFQSNSAGTDPGVVYISSDATTPADGVAIGILRFSAANHSTATQIETQRDGGTWTAGSSQPSRLVFSTTPDSGSSPTERMRLSQDGTIRQFSSSTTLGAAFASSEAAGTTTALLSGRRSATSTISGNEVFKVWTNGDVANTNDVYGAISDIKLKENIVDAESQWDDFKAVRFRKYNFKEETGHETHTQLGVIAQELELVSPGLVTETPDLDEDGNDLGTTTKSVKYSILIKKALVALQEAMERIETLEQRLSDAGIA